MIQLLMESSLLKISISKLMVVVAVSAINMFLIMLFSRNPNEARINRYFLELALLGVLPMVDVLAVASMFRGEGQRFLDSFLIAGGIVLAVDLGIIAVFPLTISGIEIQILDGLFGPNPNGRAVELLKRGTLGVILNLAPQLAFAALFGGWLARRPTRLTSV